MVLLSKITLPGSDKHGKKTPVVQLSASQCIKWLNPRRQALGMSLYAEGSASASALPPVEQLRSEIIDAIQNGTYNNANLKIHDDAAEPRARDSSTSPLNTAMTMRKLMATNSISLTDIWTASYHGRQREVEYYVTSSIDANVVEFGYPNQTPLHYAAAGGAMATAQYLLAHGANPIAVDVNRNST
ncbi:Aste57867_17295 [Aphanomyces stellatus]|uniref:Aste57867_17295 protein n=1 Tax=Aphanomyces stellatus TaxID=120398 RepID=A0A485KBG3_9STRA|nr:hypothetical protein As57867_017236 [Aphanomyces stellatus]KAF0713641.1 hypothetical protein As57867_004252 [Aphanomyces stellatus]VFT81378.1 Aste57867_4263 [Aphanomyces stellatus]VFT94051.1 Aste57867_17295 [Aphanomyces stellatus]